MTATYRQVSPMQVEIARMGAQGDGIAQTSEGPLFASYVAAAVVQSRLV